MARTLRVGNRGPDVKAVQEQLNRCLNADLDLDPDGIYGNETEKAVRRFQQHVGFPKHLQDGIVGPKTMTALFGIFNLTVSADLKPKATHSEAVVSANPSVKPATSNTVESPKAPATDPSSTPKSSEDPLTRMQGTFQLGGQYSRRDGGGFQAQLGFTLRSRYFFPRSGEKKFFHYMRFEGMAAPAIGIPLPGGSIFTGQINLTVSPVTDWLVYNKIWHFLTPSITALGQAPINHPNLSGKVDPSSSKRLGGAFGLEFLHVDVVKDRLSIGLSGQEAGYWDFKSHKVIWDPSIMMFIQFNLGDGWMPYKPLTNP